MHLSIKRKHGGTDQVRGQTSEDFGGSARFVTNRTLIRLAERGVECLVS